ncbi:hypothetical protein [Pedobacter xixiisoli]|uniref:Uncharacterized protein n=1 Tax=Pedobacter xixiisoli TaxID=1476464 RepID=A0A285ZRB5_9SPHI|nr:hypothetical protein [Pedobacter xixiisoli]SOD12172.1 hypothetical protein SAMN06297358_0530 [Pedobacter xixiisoli]
MNNYFSYPMSNHVDDNLMIINDINSNDSEFYNVSSEILPTIKTLISLCAEQGLFIKILNRSTVVRKYLIDNLDFDITAAYEATENPTNITYHNFGLAFGVGIYESSASGKLKYLDHKMLYDKVAKIGESIGLTWAGNLPFLSNLRYFELRPNWASNMNDKEMMNELYRRKDAQVSLLA